MKAIIIIYVALLPSIISGVSGDESLNRNNYIFRPHVIRVDTPAVAVEVNEMTQARTILDQMVTNGGNIGNIFQPSRLLDNSSLRIVYEGQLIRNNNKMVAMKFASSTRDDLKNEYEMYTYLNAINNSAVENYGIPAVYYYGEWEGYRMLAITLLYSKYHLQINWSNLDIMIIFREFVRISKYAHSRGIFHDRSVVWKIMFRGNKAFLLSFKDAAKLSDWLVRDVRKTEWRKFWLNMRIVRRLDDETVNALPERGLKKVLLNFKAYAYDADKVDYDEMHDIITEEIRWQDVQEPALLSWLTDAQHAEASAEWERTPDIRAIDDPYAVQFDYPAPNYTYFA